jgi:hypothetical protein
MPRKEMIIDPPEGWKHGFPKILPEHLLVNIEEIPAWLIENGYPEEDIEIALKYSRFWEREV